MHIFNRQLCFIRFIRIWGMQLSFADKFFRIRGFLFLFNEISMNSIYRKHKKQ